VEAQPRASRPRRRDFGDGVPRHHRAGGFPNQHHRAPVL
ncbi:MAG: hypothetical protein AVDCRST_MAG73-3608, partial [uncultured Thermomicrobiales bacterium]